MNFLVIGLNHQTTPVELREKFAVSGEDLVPVLLAIKERVSLVCKDLMLLSTCNRTELYFFGEKSQDILELASEWLADYSKQDLSTLREYLYKYDNNTAVKHLFRVASGLESMAVGEPQILGQIKSAVKQAEVLGVLNNNLHFLFEKAFSVAKRVRTNTEIGNQSISMAAISVQLVKQVFGDLKNSRILFVGAGEMIQLCLSHYYDERPAEIVVANRNLARGEKISANYDAKVIPITGVNRELERFDVVITCTASSLPIIGQGTVSTAIKKRKNRPIVLIDLAVPRDIETEVKNVDNVFLFTLDDLGRRIESNLKSRLSAIEAAEKLISNDLISFNEVLTNRKSKPLILAIKERAEEIQRLELEAARKKVLRGVNTEEVLMNLAKGISNKFVHGAFTELQSGSFKKNKEAEYWIKKLYGLETPEIDNEEKFNTKN